MTITQPRGFTTVHEEWIMLLYALVEKITTFKSYVSRKVPLQIWDSKPHPHPRPRGSLCLKQFEFEDY